jgi:8-oxo-dGTP diphosphatase
MRRPMTRTADETLYFVEHDGRVFLVVRDAVLSLPTRAEVPFAIHEKRVVAMRGGRVAFCSPAAEVGHDAWPWKDELPFQPGVDSLARSAANVSMVRVVAKGAFTRPGEVLLVRPKVGFFAGRWSLPGGYLDYGESPEACLVREVEEELGVRARVVRLLDVDSQVVGSGLHFLAFLYEGVLDAERFTLKDDEISDARWFALEGALAEVGSALSRKGLERLLKEDRPR